MGPLISAGRDSPEEPSRAVGEGEVVWSQLALGLVLVGVSRTLPQGARKAVSEIRVSGVARRHSHHRLGYSHFRVPIGDRVCIN